MATEQINPECFAKKDIFHHLSKPVVDKAVIFSLEIGAYIKHLDMFGVCGIIGIPMFHKVLNYLKEQTDVAEFNYYERKGLIWCPTIGEALDRQFRGQPKPIQKKISAPAHYNDGLTKRTTK